MKKTCLQALCMLLCAVMLCACLPNGSRTQTPGFSSSTQSDAGVSVPAAQYTGSLTIALPDTLAALGDVLTELAAADGIVLTVRTAASGSGYASGVKAMLAGGNAPALVWLADDADAKTLGGTAVLAELTSEVTSPVFTAMAGIAPAQNRLLDEDAVYGLPLGSYAGGYVVNLALLGALLGTTNLTALLQDLNECTFAQFSALANALEQYLAKPGRMRLSIGSHVYQTPDYRPTTAQTVRGIFAVPDADADALMQTALGASVMLVRQAQAETDAADISPDAGNEVLLSFLALLDFETMHMGRREGAMRRGEDYTALDIALSAEDALQQFADGTALFWRGDSRAAYALVQQTPALADQLGMMPLKFPPLEEEEPEAESTPEEGSSEAESTAPEDPAPTAEATTVAVTNALLAEASTRLWTNTGGFLCLTKAGAASADAQALLLRLFATEVGADAIKEQLYLQPFSDLFPASPLAVQVANAAAGDGQVLAVRSDALERAAPSVGTYLMTDLMGKAEWDETDAAGFLSTCRLALGSLLSTPQAPDAAESAAEE